MRTRRQMTMAPMASGATPAAYATREKGRPLSAMPGSASPIARPRNADRIVGSPQCLIGFPEAPRTEHLVASLHCDATRTYFRREGARLRTDLLSGRRRILLTHYARTANEVPVVVELLKLSDADYPVALMGAFALASKIDADLTIGDIHLLVEESGFVADSMVEEDELTLAVIATRRAFCDHVRRGEMPFTGEITA